MHAESSYLSGFAVPRSSSRTFSTDFGTMRRVASETHTEGRKDRSKERTDAGFARRGTRRSVREIQELTRIVVRAQRARHSLPVPKRDLPWLPFHLEKSGGEDGLRRTEDVLRALRPVPNREVSKDGSEGRARRPRESSEEVHRILLVPLPSSDASGSVQHDADWAPDASAHVRPDALRPSALRNGTGRVRGPHLDREYTVQGSGWGGGEDRVPIGRQVGDGSRPIVTMWSRRRANGTVAFGIALFTVVAYAYTIQAVSGLGGRRAEAELDRAIARYEAASRTNDGKG